jgi:hypothetical protein
MSCRGLITVRSFFVHRRITGQWHGPAVRRPGRTHGRSHGRSCGGGASRSQPVLTHGYSEKPVFTSLPGVPQMRCLLVWGQRDDPLAGQLTLHAARVSGAHCSDRPASP